MSVYWIIKFKDIFSRDVTDGYETYSIVGKTTKKKEADILQKNYQSKYNKKQEIGQVVEYIVREQTNPKSKYIAFIYNKDLSYYDMEFWEKDPPNNWKEINDKDYEKGLFGHFNYYAELLRYRNKSNRSEGRWATSLPLEMKEDSDEENVASIAKKEEINKKNRRNKKTAIKKQSDKYTEEKSKKDKKQGYVYHYILSLVQDTHWYEVYGPPGEDFIIPYSEDIRENIIKPILRKLLRNKTISKVKIESDKGLIFLYMKVLLM